MEMCNEFGDSTQLKHFNVRYSSFSSEYKNYAKEDSSLPGCVLAKHGFFYDSSSKSLKCHECAYEHLNNEENDEEEILGELIISHYRFNRSCFQAKKSLKSYIDNDQVDEEQDSKNQSLNNDNYDTASLDSNNNLKYETFESRLETFKSVRLLIDPCKLAENGLYLTVNFKDNKNDNELSMLERTARSLPHLYHVKCSFCSYDCLLFRNSYLNTMYKSPFDEHKEKSSAKCPIFKSDEQKSSWLKFLLSFENPKSDKEEIYDVSSLSMDACVELSSVPKILDLIRVELNLELNKAHNDLFNDYESRLKSFREWPPSSPKQPSDLAKAGFYYYGIKDMVKCFYCNGGLQNWNFNDDPCADHVRWFPECKFIQNLMRIKMKIQKPNLKIHHLMNTDLIRKIIDNKLINYESLKNAFNHRLTSSYNSIIDTACFAYDLEHENHDSESLSDFLIYGLPHETKITQLRNFFSIEHNLNPSSVRIIKQQHNNNVYCLVSLKKDDRLKLDELIRDFHTDSILCNNIF
jgi:hypothetical protein